jgi:hypothetical protein
VKLFKSILNAMQEGKKREVLKYLRQLPTWHLEELGFSPDLLRQGMIAWPWQEGEHDKEIKKLECAIAEETRSVNELSSYTDAELHDLGISRGSIKTSVRYGRPGIEHTSTIRAA